jgi:radial spoke head protein 9
LKNFIYGAKLKVRTICFKTFEFIACLTDYYVAMGVNYLGHQEFAKKTFFWCTGDNMNFSELPPSLRHTCQAVLDQVQSVFTGEFDKTVVEANGISQFAYIDKDVLAKTKLPARGITELDRLSYVVHQIENDCHIVPVGSFKKIPLKETRKNEAFRGLKANEISNISNYTHFRVPQHKKKVDLNFGNECIYNNDFLDNASESQPHGQWNVLKDTTGTTSVIRSKLWPGWYSFHKANTNIFGGLYIGNGCKALDMAFMF